MKRFLSALLLLPVLSIAQVKTQIPIHKGMKLVWSDEFNYTGLPDSSKWGYDVGGHGFGNNEQQFYTAGRMENARVADGKLTIEAIREKWPADSANANNYTSARLVTKGRGDWLYGRVDVRARLPEGRGTWPAIWMLPSKDNRKWPDDGEIDIMEHVGYDPGQVHGSVHSKKYNHTIGTQKTSHTTVPSFSSAFHVYSMEWDKEQLRIYVDGKEFFRYKNEHSGPEAWPLDQPFHVILNLAVGGLWGGAKGVDETIWPRKMEVDYVRVYSRKK